MFVFRCLLGLVVAVFGLFASGFLCVFISSIFEDLTAFHGCY